ncbi:MAG: DNA-directed RNA polymerase subunit beta [Oscillospiraceae bacterium]|nr:DNA-directed RNA polymerase subunit beta [Oscillospiraceae bacterium]
MVNTKPVKSGKTTRQSFSKINEVIDMPNLISIQKDSYQWFLDEGIKEVFKDVSPIVDSNGKFELSFIDYRMDEPPKYSIEECKERDATYAAPLKVTARLFNKETDEPIDNEIYMGDMPLMTESGTFVINGSERVVVSQLVRSPGVYFGFDYDKTGKKLFKATVIPNRGAWLELEMDGSDVFYVRIDKNRKFACTTFLRSIGLSSDQDLINKFGEDPRITATIDSGKDNTKNEEEALLEVYRKLRPGEPATVDSARTTLDNLFFDAKRYDLARFGRYKYNKKLAISARITGRKAAENIVAPLTGEVLLTEGEIITKEKALEIQNAGVMDVAVYKDDGEGIIKVVGNGMVDIHEYVPADMDVEKLGINEQVKFGVLAEILEEADGDDEKLAQLIEQRSEELIPKHITLEDIFATVGYFINLNEGIGDIDDIDHLGNRRIRCVGELLQNQFRIGFTRMERTIRERMGLWGNEQENVTPDKLINARQVIAAMKEFFGSSPLSQFMDQNNPLAELTHKRRLSSLGPGGLSRDRAGFEVRDVHYSHYGRMCPIETPEGPNIGLISYLATFARINCYGFIEAPYRKVDKETGVVLDEVVYMTADVEDNYVVAQANEPLDEQGRFARPRVNARCRDAILEIEREKVDFMDVSPKMVVSVATAMIPFLENDDANRALMGANMQRQAVPLIVTDNPIVGTGMEYKAAVDSGVVVCAKEDGVVTEVSADRIVITADNGTEHLYKLIKFKRSNQGNCVNQRPIVEKGEIVHKGDVIADGPATKNGEIALGKNALIGFMTWEGYNYEDAVLINEKLVYNDVYTSIHIEEYELECRETKLGPEEITRDIPNLSDDVLKDLDERGIVRIGAEVHSGDILVGKVSPKGETELTAEEKLLRAIFGEKAREVRDNSLRVAHGESGIVVDVKVFNRENCDDLAPGVNEKVRVYIAQKRKISVGDKMAGRHGNKGVVSRILKQEDMPFLPDGTPLDIVLNPLGVPSRMNIGQVLEVHLGYVAKALGWKVATPVFDGAHEQDIRALYDEAREKKNELLGENSAGLDFTKLPWTSDCKTQLTDGRTGEKFDGPVTVGYMYYLKLHHLVDDKIHARSTGPYSLVTQQPLGGKAQFGGQRFGEMEVWALEAYGAAYTLQEILTVKSDDLMGRQKTYEAIVKGEDVPKPGVPESFKVMVSELMGLGLDVRILDEDNKEINLNEDLDDEDDNSSYGKASYNEEYKSDDSAFASAGYEVTDAADAGGVTDSDDLFSEDDEDYDEADEDFDDGLDDDEEFGEPKDPDNFDDNDSDDFDDDKD